MQASVSQHSVLAALLYNLYTNEIPQHPKTQLVTFADDKALYMSHKNLKFATNKIN